ncbi:MAG: beta-N-acetylhexosaminidase [Chitinophagaceae bacterium]|nr:beta-N-acetylhexosaminidase [Chitinophagaceae bacterium]
MRKIVWMILAMGIFRASGQQDLHLIPYPKEVRMGEGRLALDGQIAVVTDRRGTEGDRLAAGELLQFFKGLGVSAHAGGAASTRIRLTRAGADRSFGEEGYSLSVDKDGAVIRANDEAGLYYGVATMMQLVSGGQGGSSLPYIQIRDWPDTRIRAVHYDTKHHQDTKDFVEAFIRDLSHYKINMLVWEWEDKFAYPSHPEIGAPGAFTLQEMQELTRYARKFHIQIVPLVQGLGHASFILKWPQFAGLREIPASNFEFCPLKDSTYQLLDDLWQDALKATPGSRYIHIGSDETYELGACPLCRKKDNEIGRSGLYHLFLDRSAAALQGKGRQVMAWESPMGWEKSRLKVYSESMRQDKPVVPRKGLVLTESYEYETPDLQYARKARSLGYPVMAYDPNPGIEQLFLPYFFSKDGKGHLQPGSLENSYRFLQTNMGKGVFDGVIRTSWDDSGLPMQAWMLQFILTAGYSWNAKGPSLETFTRDFFAERYGAAVTGMDSLYGMLNQGAYFFMESFERRVWAWGEIGKTHLPDLPRGDALEYDPYWNTAYADRVTAAREFVTKMDSAEAICRRSLDNGVKNREEVEVFATLVDLIRHTALTYLDLSALELSIKKAHELRFVDLDSSYHYLQQAERIVSRQLERRQQVFDGLVKVWERTRLPKGMDNGTKKYFFEQDRTRHFANRAPDMTYLIMDERKLGLEAYLLQLQDYMRMFRLRFHL